MPSKKNHLPKAIAILGTTSAGKTRLAVSLALKIKGEVISADSRQVYVGLDVGTGKDLAEYQRGQRTVRHHLIDVASPRRQFNLSRYQKMAEAALADVLWRGKVPILVGGSGLYLQSVVDSFQLPSGRLLAAEKKIWSKLSAAELLQKIAQLKPEFAERLNNSDRNNARRLVRYLEIIKSGAEPNLKGRSPYDWLVIGIKLDDQILRQRIKERLFHRLSKEGLVEEVKNLHQAGLSWARLKSFGLEYRFVSRFLLGELDYPEMVEKLETALWRYAKRQTVWFRRWEKQGRKIHWVTDFPSVQKIIYKWIKKSP